MPKAFTIIKLRRSFFSPLPLFISCVSPRSFHLITFLTVVGLVGFSPVTISRGLLMSQRYLCSQPYLHGIHDQAYQRTNHHATGLAQ
jgi:hypothetical protein